MNGSRNDSRSLFCSQTISLILWLGLLIVLGTAALRTLADQEDDSYPDKEPDDHGQTHVDNQLRNRLAFEQEPNGNGRGHDEDYKQYLGTTVQ